MRKREYLYIFIIAVLLGAVYYLNKKSNKLFTNLIGTTEKYEQLTAHVAKLENNYVNQLSLKEKALSSFQQETKVLKDQIKVLTNVAFQIREKARKSEMGDLIYSDDENSFVVTEIRLKDGPALGYVLVNKDGSIVSSPYKLEFNTEQVVSRDSKTGKYSVLAKSYLISKTPSILAPEWVNKKYPLNIINGKAFIDPTEYEAKAKIHWFNPKFNVSGTLENNEFLPGFNLTLSSFGKTKADSKLKFLGLGYTKDLGFTVTPILYRPFNILPNTYIGGSLFFEDQIKPAFSVQIGL